jgi:hypothetical protein
MAPLLVRLYRPDVQAAATVTEPEHQVAQDGEHEHRDQERPERVRPDETHERDFRRPTA